METRIFQPTLSYIEEILNSPDWGGFKFYMPDDVRKPNIGGWKKDREYLRIDGSVDAKERGDLIDTFHSDTAAGNQAKLFLISTNAGGLGINLIAANRVVLVSLWLCAHPCYTESTHTICHLIPSLILTGTQLLIFKPFTVATDMAKQKRHSVTDYLQKVRWSRRSTHVLLPRLRCLTLWLIMRIPRDHSHDKK